MASGWFHTRDGKSKSGPVSSAQLQTLAESGQLLPTDMVWREGMAKWIPARRINGLFNQAADAVTAKKQPVVSSAITSSANVRQQVVSRPQQNNQRPRQVDEKPESSESRVGKGKAVFAIVSIAAAACAAGIVVLVAVFLNSGRAEKEVAEHNGKGNPLAGLVAKDKKEALTEQPMDKGTENNKAPKEQPKEDGTDNKEPPPEQPKDKGTDKKTKEKKETPDPPKKEPSEKAATDKPATAKDHLTVIAEGLGTTGDESLKDAFRNAVRQVVGAVVAAETLVKNDQIISDKVLTYSDGFVKSYDEISKTDNKGLVRTKIKATVECRSVIAKLKAANIAVRDLDGKGIFAEVVTQLDAEKNAAALVEKALQGFPLNVMEAEVVGKPEVVAKSESKVKLKMGIRFTVNPKGFDRFAERLRRVLESVAKEKHEFSLASSAYPEYKGSMALASDKDVDLFKRFGSRKYGPLSLALNTQRTANLDRSEWRFYVIDETCRGPLANCSRFLTAKVSLLGEEGKLIAVDTFSAKGENRPTDQQTVILPIMPGERRYVDFAFLQPTGHAYSIPTVAWVSPFFLEKGRLIAYGKALMRCSAEITVHRIISLSLDEVKQVRNIKCELSQ